MTYDELEKFIVKLSPKHPEWEKLKKEMNEILGYNFDDESVCKFLLGLDTNLYESKNKE
jgi:hypothetical protein